MRHRVNEILRLSNRVNWGHCPGEQNPADLGSRGCKASVLKSSELWWKGPFWLSYPEESWPVPINMNETVESRQEIKKTAVVSPVMIEVNCLTNIFEIGRFPTLKRLLKVTSLVMRFISNVRAKKIGREIYERPITACEIKQAEIMWVKAAQLQLQQQGNYNQLAQGLGIVKNEGLLRCQGRLQHSELEREGRKPLILPKEHPFTTLVIKSCHERVLHSGLRATLAEVRSRFWIPKGRQAVKSILGKCLKCKRHEGKAFSSPQPASLPEFRVRRAVPFSKVGVDFAGPLFIKEGKETRKVYITLWTCCVTRAVHLDLVQNLSASTFMKCFRRFISRRGCPSDYFG